MQNKLKIALYNIDKYCDACYVKGCQKCTLFTAAKTLREVTEDMKPRTVNVTMNNSDSISDMVEKIKEELTK